MACLPYEEDRRLALAGSLRREARLESLSGDLFWVNDSAEDRGPLKLKASIAPSQSQWPTEHLHWQRLGGRRRGALSVGQVPRADGKAEERKKAAEKALAAFAGSRTLARAQGARPPSWRSGWEAKVTGVIKRASDAHEVAIHAQIREKLAGMKDMKDRMVFLERHGDDPRSRTCPCPLSSRG